MNLQVNDIKVFVPAKVFERSLAFYKALSWQQKWLADDKSLAVLELNGSRFYLQNYYQKDWANNFMLHIAVEDAHAWWQHVTSILANGNFKPARVSKPKDEGYAIVTHVWDPSGVLLHFAQFTHARHNID